jgi:ubiquinone/menaquinone biosynthesis C-methylase UbiE
MSSQVQLEKTYNAAADHYDHPALSFWDRFGSRTVERSPLSPGMSVLDICCGIGGSALPAAERVGATGHVIAVDLAQNLLAKGIKRAEERGLKNIEFRRGDLADLPFANESFDAVICAFGIFFAPDLHSAVRTLWRLVRPAGFLALTVWGAKLFEPADDKFWAAVGREDPQLLASIKPWSKIVEPDPFRSLLVECEIPEPTVVKEPGTHLLSTPGDWWTIILGSGYRATVDALSPDDREKVRTAALNAIKVEQIREIRADVIYSIASKPGRDVS